ncbi:MAG TPA: T9SS type A sorting domain-containing protein [Bacteroidia bacterium]|nr:T9SS type A sorting domain-containing protein [Bacteroidia bacterium]
MADSRSFAQGTSNPSQAPGATQLSPPTTPTVVTDTLNYFFNKQFFKIPSPQIQGYPYYKSAAATGTNFTHMGAAFVNTDPNLVINGLESRLAYQFNSNATSIPIRMYLYNVDANMLPTTVIDSVSKSIGAAQVNSTVYPTGYPVSGSFTSVAGPVSHTVPGNFAVLVRNLSTLAGDTVRIYRTSSMVSPSTNLQPRGEGLGIVRQAGVFKKTTNFNNINFGNGTDYEFCVAPICTFTLIADHIAPPKVDSQPVDTVGCWEPLTFTNTSSPEWTNRFFNLNEFYRHHWPFANSPATGWSADSAISWYFDDEDIDYPNLRPNIILKNNATTATKYYDTSGCFTSCSMRARYRKMTAMGSSEVIWGNIDFSLCVSCWWSGVGVNEIPTLNGVAIFPNPAVDGKVKISGLKGGEHSIQVFDMLGSLKATIRTRDEEVTIDLLKEPAGAYLIRVSDQNQRYRNVKIVNQRE